MTERSPDTTALRTLDAVLRWTRAAGLPWPTVVTQDEYTHDVVVAAAANRWLVFDTT